MSARERPTRSGCGHPDRPPRDPPGLCARRPGTPDPAAGAVRGDRRARGGRRRRRPLRRTGCPSGSSPPPPTRGPRRSATPAGGRPRRRWSRSRTTTAAPRPTGWSASPRPPPARRATSSCRAGPSRTPTRCGGYTAWPSASGSRAPSGWYETCNIAYPRELLERLGGFDAAFAGNDRGDYPVGGEDTDLGLRARAAGAELVFEPAARRPPRGPLAPSRPGAAGHATLAERAARARPPSRSSAPPFRRAFSAAAPTGRSCWPRSPCRSGAGRCSPPRRRRRMSSTTCAAIRARRAEWRAGCSTCPRARSWTPAEVAVTAAAAVRHRVPVL